MKKRIPIATTLALVLMAIALSVSATMIFAMNRFSSTISNVNARQALFDYLDNVDKVVRDKYAGTVDEELLKEKLASTYMQSIGDNYADYLTPDEYAQVQQRISGTVSGFGLELALQADVQKIVVSSVAVGSPADQAGMKPGDELGAVDGKAIPGTLAGLEEVTSDLEDYAKILLTVTRDGKQQSFELARGEYELISVTGKMIGNVGYIRISDFNNTTAVQFSAMVEQHISAGAQSLIFDLRQNAGGVLTAATDSIAYLMPHGVFANSTSSDGTVTPLSSMSEHTLQLPTVTLVNGGTAGEAELFAGVLQEFGMTTVVGEKTAGRAFVQEYYALSSDNAAVKLSVAELSLLKGGSWDGKGILPDNLLEARGSSEYLDLMSDEDDAQLQAALSILNSAKVSTATEPTATATATTTATGTKTKATGSTAKTTAKTTKATTKD